MGEAAVRCWELGRGPGEVAQPGEGKGSLGHSCLFLGYRTNIATIVIHWVVLIHREVSPGSSRTLWEWP